MAVPDGAGVSVTGPDEVLQGIADAVSQLGTKGVAERAGGFAAMAISCASATVTRPCARTAGPQCSRERSRREPTH